MSNNDQIKQLIRTAELVCDQLEAYKHPDAMELAEVQLWHQCRILSKALDRSEPMLTDEEMATVIEQSSHCYEPRDPVTDPTLDDAGVPAFAAMSLDQAAAYYENFLSNRNAVRMARWLRELMAHRRAFEISEAAYGVIRGGDF